MPTTYFTRNYNTPQIGSVAKLRNPNIEGVKRNSDGRGNHPHVIIRIQDGIAECIALSSSGDIYIERNRNHFIPPESCPEILDRPSWAIPHRGRTFIPVSEFRRHRFAQISDAALDLILSYEDHFQDVNAVDPHVFAPVKGATYPYSDTIRVDVTTNDIFRELGIRPRRVGSYVIRRNHRSFIRR